MEYLDSPIISNNMIDHIDQSKSKNNRTQTMSYLQGSSIIKEELIFPILTSNKDDLNNTHLMYLCACNERFTTKDDINLFMTEKGQQNKFGITALMYLCNHCKISISSIKALNIEINKKDSNLYTALMYYCKLKHPYTYVIDLLKSEIGNIDFMGRTALMHFFETEKDSFVLKDINIFYNLMKDEIGKKCFLGRTALMRYIHRDRIQQGFINMLKDEIGMQDYNGNTALLLYLMHNTTPSMRIIRSLIKECNITNNFGISPLIFIKNKLINTKDSKYHKNLNYIKNEISKIIGK